MKKTILIILGCLFLLCACDGNVSSQEQTPVHSHSLKKELLSSDEHYNYFKTSCTDCDYSAEEKELKYAIGDIGPAGGYIVYILQDKEKYYTEKSSVSYREHGIYLEDVYEYDWLYVVAAPFDLVVEEDGKPRLGTSIDDASEVVFGYFRMNWDDPINLLSSGTEIFKYYDPIENIYYNGDLYDVIGATPYNTKRLTYSMLNTAYTSLSGSETTDRYAARLCYILTTQNNGQTFDDWQLPSVRTMDCIRDNLFFNNVGNIPDASYWTSSEEVHSSYKEGDITYKNSHASYYWFDSDYFGLGDKVGSAGGRLKSNTCRVRPVRLF